MASYTKEDRTRILNTVCDRLSNGEALRTILKEKDMIDSTTFYKWIDSDAEKAKQYAQAREAREEFIFEEILEIADETENDTTIIDIGDDVNITKVNNEAIQRSRLRVDTRKWMLGKMNSNKYGDKIQQETTIKDESFTPETKKDLNDLVRRHNENEAKKDKAKKSKK